MSVKNLILILFIISAAAAYSNGRQESHLLKQADSLFAKQKYTEALSKYKVLMDSFGVSSTAMLLKVAYIEEALENYPEALYALSQFQKKEGNTDLINLKLEELASTQSLDGYKVSDRDILVSFYRKSYSYILLSMLLLFVLISAIITLQLKKGKRTKLSFSLVPVAIIFLLLFINPPVDFREGIIIKNNVNLMKSPSPGAPQVSAVKEGHRVEVTGKVDIWYKVRWQGQDVFIRESNIKLI